MSRTAHEPSSTTGIWLMLLLIGPGLAVLIVGLFVGVFPCDVCTLYPKSGAPGAPCPWCKEHGVPLIRRYVAKKPSDRWCPYGNQGSDGKWQGHWVPPGWSCL
jgi:hypothetical protein